MHIENTILRNHIHYPSTRRSQTINPLPPTIIQPHAPNVPPAVSQAVRPARTTVPTQCMNCHHNSHTPHCSNCHRDGHTELTCFQPGGAMEGRREKYLANRFPKPIAHIAEVKNNQTDIEENPCIIEETTISNEFAAMSLGTSNDTHYTTYALSSLPEISTDLPFAPSSISQGYNAALDLACTNHIFRDQDVFHTYNVEGAVPVKTANCGTLTMLGIGNVNIKLVIGDRTVIWTLTNCLHAPDVPINLISVGTLQEH